MVIWPQLVFASLILLLITTFLVPEVEDQPIRSFTTNVSYGVIVDCGSSGSRAHIFRWKTSDQSRTVELVREEGKAVTHHITPGLSAFKDDPDKASDYLEPIMQFISKYIPPDYHLNTPIFFLATAGMRLLDDTVRRKILKDVTTDLRAKFNFPKIKSKVISGSMEGVYSWLSLNADQNTIDQSNQKKTYGMLEMGGASVQITFELDQQTEAEILNNLKDKEATKAFKNQSMTIDLVDGRSVQLFATTFLGLGVNSAREAFIDLLVKDHLDATESLQLSDELKLKKFDDYLVDPCLTTGSSEIVSRPIDSLRKSNPSIGLITKPGEETFTVKLKGGGNFLSCHLILERALQIMKKERLNCSPDKFSCSMELLGSAFVPFEKFPFIGLSEFFFTTNEMMNLAGPFDREKVLHETNRICSSDYNELNNAYLGSTITESTRILYECFKASWLLTVLHTSGFKMPPEYKNFQTVNKLNGKEIDWTIGAMITEVASNGKSQ